MQPAKIRLIAHTWHDGQSTGEEWVTQAETTDGQAASPVFRDLTQEAANARIAKLWPGVPIVFEDRRCGD